MVAMSNELVVQNLTIVGALATHINLKQRKYFSALDWMTKNVICKFSGTKQVLKTPTNSQINLIRYPFKIHISKSLIIYFRFNGKSVQKAKYTTFNHHRIYQLATYVGQPFTTGSSSHEHGGSSYNHAKTDIMSLETGEWRLRPDYPFYKM